MARKYKNPVLAACATEFRRDWVLSDKIAEQSAIAHKAKVQAKKWEQKQRDHHVVMCKAITDEILSRDLELDDKERKFLSMPIRYYERGPQKVIMTLLEDLLRRDFHWFYPPVDKYRVISLARVYKIVGIETKLGLFFKNLNKKFEGILKIKVGDFNFMRLEPYNDKITVSIEFVKNT